MTESDTDMPQGTSEQSSVKARSWATLACAIFLLLLAAAAALLGLTTGWFVDVRLIWIVTAVLGTWLSGRTAFLSRRAGATAAVVRTGWGLAAAGVLVLTVDLGPLLASEFRAARRPISDPSPGLSKQARKTQETPTRGHRDEPAVRPAHELGISPETISLRLREDKDIEVEGAAGTLPRDVLSRRWQAVVRDGDSHQWPVAIGEDGSLRGVLPTSNERKLKEIRDLHLELLDDAGRGMARLLLGPITTDEGRTVRLVRGRPLRWTTPDGVVVVFDGTIRDGETAWVTVEPSDPARCRERLPAALGWAGSWRVDSRVQAVKPELYHQRSPRDMVEGPPLIDLLFPAPQDVSEDAMVFDTRCVNTGMSGEWSRLFLLRDIGGIKRVDDARYLSFRRKYAVQGHDGNGPEELEPGTVYDQPLDGHHALIFEREAAFTLVAGDYSGRNWSGDFIVHENTMVRETSSAPYLAAPLPVYGVDLVTRSNRTLAILPVLADKTIELETRDMSTGWFGSRLTLRAVRRQTDTAIFVGDLDELTAAQRRADN